MTASANGLPPPALANDDASATPSRLSSTTQPRKGGTSIETTIFIVVALVLHALYLSTQTSSPSAPSALSVQTSALRGVQSENAVEGTISSSSEAAEAHHPRRPGLPELFIYRRTRKTGSSSMVNALLRALVPLGYVGVKQGEDEVDPVVRNEYIRPYPRKLFVVHHNQVTKAAHPLRNAMIADTIRDGFETITSYCRQKLHIQSCERDDMISCLKAPETQAQVLYRFVNSTEETDETYIDLPLSSKHRALSTTVMRTVFPNVTLHVDYYNVHESACSKENVDPEVAQLYNELYSAFDDQVTTLQKRMLGIAGFPFIADKREKVTLNDMMDAADLIEAPKYQFEEARSVKGKPSEIIDILKQEQIWERDGNGKLSLKKKRKSLG